jgi:hypothetical protein
MDSPSLDGWLGIGRAGSPRPQERETDAGAIATAGHTAAHNASVAPGKTVLRGRATNLGLEVSVEWAWRWVAGMLDTVRSHSHPVRHPLTHTPFRLSSTNHNGLARSNQWSSVKNSGRVRQK